MTNPIIKLWKTDSIRLSIKVAVLTAGLTSLFSLIDGDFAWSEPIVLSVKAFITTEAADVSGRVFQRMRRREAVTVQDSALIAGLSCLTYVAYDLPDGEPFLPGTLIAPLAAFLITEGLRHQFAKRT